MYYKIWSKKPSHIWDYVAFNQLAEGNLIKYEMKGKMAVDYAIYESDKKIDDDIFYNRGFEFTILNEKDITRQT